MQIDELIISEDLQALQAMARLEETGRRILFIAPGGVLKAVLTDSDIRKFILRGGQLSSPVSQAANYSPKHLPVEKRAAAKSFLAENNIDAVPLLDKSGHIADIIFAGDVGGVATRKSLNLPVVIMAGGLGTRLYPYTKILPKPLIPIGEVPIIERVIESYTSFGCDDFTLVVNYRKNMIKSYFSEIEAPYTLHYAEEEKPLGTGGGLSLLKGQIDAPFFLANCDSLISADYADIYEAHRQQGNAITMVCATKQYVIPYGVIELSDEGGLSGISEKPCLNYLVNTGMYLVQPEVLDDIEPDVSQGFPDIIEAQRKKGGRIGVYPISEASWMDMGQIEELDAMRRKFENN